MNVNSPFTTRTTQPAAPTLPIKRETNGTATSNGTTTTPTPSSNPPHLGNSIDTTA